MITNIYVCELTLNEDEKQISLFNNSDLILKYLQESINSLWINIRCDYLMADNIKTKNTTEHKYNY